MNGQRRVLRARQRPTIATAADVTHALAVEETFEQVAAIPAARAAEILEVDVRTIYRRLENSIAGGVRPTSDFNAPEPLEIVLRQSGHE